MLFFRRKPPTDAQVFASAMGRAHSMLASAGFVCLILLVCALAAPSTVAAPGAKPAPQVKKDQPWYKDVLDIAKEVVL